MPYLDPQMMAVFRSKIRNPATMWRVYYFMRKYRLQHLRHPEGAYSVVDGLSRIMGVPVTPAQRASAAQWLMQSPFDPQNRAHRHAAWAMIWNYW